MTPCRPSPRITSAFVLMGCLLAIAGPARSAATRTLSPVPPLDHIIVVIMENQRYDAVRSQPYTASLIANSSSFSMSFGVTHPSQPNYIALWAGTTLGITNDNCPLGPYTATNLGSACEAAGLRWRAYSENLPVVGGAACTYGSSPYPYTRKHDPWTNFSNLDHDNERPYSDLAVDIANDSLPNLAFVVPNNCDNTHDCPAATGDTWLSSNVPAMLQAVGPYGIVILTWDEDDFTQLNHILTVVAGEPVLANYLSSRSIKHYSVLRTICDGLGLAPFGASALADSAITDIWKPTAGVPETPIAGIALSAPAPNPTHSGFSARLRLPEAAWIDATVFDVAGHAVRRLASGVRSGDVTLSWDGLRGDGRSAGTGVFFLRVRAGGHSYQQRAVVLR